MDHGQIPVDGHDGEEKNAAVKPGEEDKSHNLADDLWEYPTPDVVDGPEGKTNGEDEIGDGQVEDEDVCQRFQVFVQTQDYKNQDVSSQTQCENNSEKKRSSNGSKFDHMVFFTEFILIIITVIISCVEWASHRWWSRILNHKQNKNLMI